MRPQLLAIYLRDNQRCWLCLSLVSEEEASVDHVLPKASGGHNGDNNLRLAHKRCNSIRGKEFPGTLQRQKGGGVKRMPKKKPSPYRIQAIQRRERVARILKAMQAGGHLGDI